ncbi:MAG TPA: pyridoxamine 5'-phosphate oxidase family protein [Nocardioides sp.]|nr:pyridoxamine 5'-phosphate oxidase family protein [Nocardioides sp.]
MTTIFELASDECDKLLRSCMFGRLVLVDGPRGVEVFPVNYTTVGDAVLVRTAPGSLIDLYAEGSPLLLEIDQVDPERGHGWSVVARGHGERVLDEERTEDERRAPGPPRWLRRQDTVWLRLRWHELSGRRVDAVRR